MKTFKDIMEVQEKEKIYVVADFSSGNLKWRTSTDQTGGALAKDKMVKSYIAADKALKSYFKKVLGTSDFTLDITKLD